MKADAATLLREARHEAGISQAELAKRLSTTQSAVARLERPGANPRVDTLDRALRAVGRQLELGTTERSPNFDLTLLPSQLRLSHAERFRMLEDMIREREILMEAGRRARE